MRPRTRLTTPGGLEPEASGRSADGARELYSHGFAIPTEPGLPARWPWVLAAVVAVLLISAFIYLFLQAAGLEEQDPSLGETPNEVPAVDR